MSGLEDSISVLEGVEAGYEHAAMSTNSSSWAGSFAVGFSSGFLTEQDYFEGASTAEASAAGEAFLGLGNSLLAAGKKVNGGYGFVGVGGNLGGSGLAGEIGFGAYVGNGKLIGGWEAYGFCGGNAGQPFYGVGGWNFPGDGSSGTGDLVGYNFGKFVVEAFYDAKNHQTYLGVSGGEGVVWGVGLCIDGQLV